MKNIFFFSLISIFIFSCNKDTSSMNNEDYSTTVIEDISLTPKEFANVHNELLATFYAKKNVTRAVSINNVQDPSFQKQFIKDFVESSIPVVEKYGTIGEDVSQEDFVAYLELNMNILVDEYCKGIDNFEAYMYNTLKNRSYLGDESFSEEIIESLKGLSNRSLREINATDYQRLLMSVFSETYKASGSYWVNEYSSPKTRVSGSTKAIVADAAFGVLAAVLLNKTLWIYPIG